MNTNKRTLIKIKEKLKLSKMSKRNTQYRLERQILNRIFNLPTNIYRVGTVCSTSWEALGNRLEPEWPDKLWELA